MSYTTTLLRSTTRSTLAAPLRIRAIPLRPSAYARGIATKKEDVEKHLKKNEIIPDVLSSISPKVQLNARFLSSGEEVSFGNTMTPVDAQGKPSIEILPFPGEDGLPKDIMGKEAYVVMTDTDAPSRDNPEWAEFCHWIHKVKVPTSKEGGEVIQNSDADTEIVEYAAPAPPEGTGQHRYVLLLLQGEGESKDVTGPSKDNRKKWGGSEQRTGVAKWAEKNGLKPIAANFFFSEQKKEQSVDDIHHDDRGLGKSGPGYGG